MRKEVKLICPWSIWVNVDPEQKNRITASQPGLGRPGLSHGFARNAASLEHSAGAQMPDAGRPLEGGGSFPKQSEDLHS